MKRKIFYWVLVILWMGLIFLFSHQPATESSELSSGITEVIVDVVNIIAPDNDLISNQDRISFIVRKSAHFGVYLVLGLLVSNGLIFSKMSRVRVIYLALLLCVLYAISDEIHQLYIPGRSGQVSDVLLDSAGSLVGILLRNVIINLDTKKASSVDEVIEGLKLYNGFINGTVDFNNKRITELLKTDKPIFNVPNISFEFVEKWDVNFLDEAFIIYSASILSDFQFTKKRKLKDGRTKLYIKPEEGKSILLSRHLFADEIGAKEYLRSKH